VCVRAIPTDICHNAMIRRNSVYSIVKITLFSNVIQLFTDRSEEVMHMAINKPDYNMRNRKYMLRYFELPLKITSDSRRKLVYD